jgi:hypothetical protein
MGQQDKKRRPLSSEELRVAERVFKRTVPYAAVSVGATTGLRNRPYTTNSAGFEDRGPSYNLHVGPHCFDGMHQWPAYQKVLIHELTHVWQSCHSAWPASLIFQSMGCQIVDGDDVGKYEAGQPWNTYDVEQQATIVADWFLRGASETSVLYPYVRDHIRKAKVMF